MSGKTISEEYYAKESACVLNNGLIQIGSGTHSMLKSYLFEAFDVTVALFPLLLLKTTSGSPSSVVTACLTPKGLIRKRNNLQYPFLASGVKPKSAKNTTA